MTDTPVVVKKEVVVHANVGKESENTITVFSMVGKGPEESEQE